MIADPSTHKQPVPTFKPRSHAFKLTSKKLKLIYSTLLLGVPRLRRQLLFPHPRWFENARPAALGGFRGSCSLWLPLRPTTRLLGSNPSTLVQKDRPLGSCSGRFCSVHHVMGRALVGLDGAGGQAAWIRRGVDGRRQLHIGTPRTGPFRVSAGECS